METIRRNGFGMDDYLDRFFNETRTENIPLVMVQVNNVETRLEVALAGFKKKVKFTEFGKLVVGEQGEER